MSGTSDGARSPRFLPRYVIVVPRDAPDTHEYLTESLRGVSGIEVVLERRTPCPEPEAPLIERRTGNGHGSNGEAFGCRLVRVSIPAPAPLRDRWGTGAHDSTGVAPASDPG
jgi:hypothetical protein